ncbi:MAG: DUF1080 domain-containing protein [Planctomycetaceae bacterium]|nr:DUF1080 domain-containing protein [Planctomycetaceae bacterium]
MRLTWMVVVAAAVVTGVVQAGEKPAGKDFAQEAEKGFVKLFDGRTLDGWQGDVKNYKVENGVLVCHGMNLYTKKQYANFVLRFEFRLPPAGNNGIGIRTPMNLDAAYHGMEIQVLDDPHPSYKGLHEYQFHGSVYGVAAAKRGFLKPTGEWNCEEIVADGSHIKVTLNGTVITDLDLSPINKTIDGREHPGLHNVKGYIGLLGHEKDPVAFRNVRIKELP